MSKLARKSLRRSRRSRRQSGVKRKMRRRPMHFTNRSIRGGMKWSREDAEEAIDAEAENFKLQALEAAEWVPFPSRDMPQSSSFLSTAQNFLEIFFIKNNCDYLAVKNLADTNSELRETIMNYPFGYSFINTKLVDVNGRYNYFNSGIFNTWNHSIKLWRQFFKNAQFLNVDDYNRYCINSDSSQYVRGIRYLRVNGCGPGKNRLSNSDFVNFKNVITLSLNIDNDTVTDEAFENLVGIQHLDISNFENITDLAFRHLKRIKTLSIRFLGGGLPRITNEAFNYIQKIKELNITDCSNININDGIFKYLQDINSLNISYCRQFTDDGLKYLKKINNLNISHCEQYTDEGLKHLKGIQHLYMSGCIQITDEGLGYLAGIKDLDISRCHQITDSGIAQLAGISILDISWCRNIKGSTLYLLKQANPSLVLRISHYDYSSKITIANQLDIRTTDTINR